MGTTGTSGVTGFNPLALHLVDGEGYQVLATYPVELPRLHGLGPRGRRNLVRAQPAIR